MEPCVSIIVPVYNAEATLRRCVESVLSQEYTDLELILADDGSRDGSGGLCDDFAQADSRVRVLHKENSGVSDTRNQALDMARGRYLQFLDADDWITPNATKLLVRTAEENQCDLVVSDFYRVVGDRVSSKGDIEDNGPLTREEYAAHMMENPADFYYGVLWNKLYRRDIVEEHHLRMDPEVSWCEDFLFNLEYIRHARRFFALQVPVYYYVKTKGSLVNQISISKTVRMKLTLFEYYNQFYKTVLDEAEYEKSRLKVYRFLIDAAQDGAAPPLPLVSTRLGSERIQVHAGTLAGEGVLSDQFRERKLLDYYLEPAAQKNSLTLPEARLLLHLRQSGAETGREDLADFAGLSRRNLSAQLQRLTGKGMVSVTEARVPDSREKRLQITFPPAAGPVLSELEDALKDFEAARLSGFTGEEKAQYARMSRRVQENIRDVLQ